ncbi:hypothetical protein SELMODRAFT_423583 [Selaginella moellendorffii]|uniref:Uncharacterized protein n=1 Tax=Selaginella moellendorffii TaxID=88036 RepID=D8SM60_SELML|nr:hypothetical protein SELMODRAFT_423583 [Selaginella moellendorffii]
MGHLVQQSLRLAEQSIPGAGVEHELPREQIPAAAAHRLEDVLRGTHGAAFPKHFNQLVREIDISGERATWNTRVDLPCHRQALAILDELQAFPPLHFSSSRIVRDSEAWKALNVWVVLKHSDSSSCISKHLAKVILHIDKNYNIKINIKVIQGNKTIKSVTLYMVQ